MPDLLSLAATASRLTRLVARTRGAGADPNPAGRDAVGAWREAYQTLRQLRSIHPRPAGWRQAFRLAAWADGPHIRPVLRALEAARRACAALAQPTRQWPHQTQRIPGARGPAPATPPHPAVDRARTASQPARTAPGPPQRPALHIADPLGLD